MKICVISAQVFSCPPPGYSGLEMIAWQLSKGLAKRGHQVSLIAPKGSYCDGVNIIHTADPGSINEIDAYKGYWQHLPEYDVIIDHSIVGKENLLVRIDGKSRWLSMKDLYSWAEERNPVLFKGGSTEVPVCGLEVPSASGLHTIQWRKVSALIRHRRKDQINEVKTKGGLRVRVTSGHSMMVAGSGCLESSKASDCVGRYSATARCIPATISDKQSWANREYALTDNELIFIGLWLGDGCYSQESSVVLSSGDETRHITEDVAKEFGVRCTKAPSQHTVRHTIHSTKLVKLMKESGLNGDCETKKFPDWIFDLSQRQIGLVLRGYFSADGYIGKRLCLFSVSKDLIEQTSILLALCGIRSNVCPVKSSNGFPNSKEGWEVNVSNDEWGRFYERVGFVQERKLLELKKRIRKKLSWRGDVPFSLIRERKFRFNASKESTLSISRLKRQKGKSIAMQFANSDIAWRRIEESKIVECHDEYVYDLSVPGTENYFVGLVCCHNSWNKFSYLLKAEGKLQQPILGVCHAPVNTMFQSWPPTFNQGSISAKIEKACAVCISDDQKDHFNALFSPYKAMRAYNGIDLDFYKPLDIPRSDRFLFLARFSSIKGADLAIKACLEVGVGLDLIGDTQITNEPDYYKECVNLSNQTSPSWRKKEKQIQIHGGRHRGECVWWFSQAKCLLHPNERFREPFGLSPVEAMACGCPVIAWDYGAMRETIRKPKTGSFVDSLEMLGVVVRQNSTLPWTPEERMECVRQASKFSIENMCKEYENLCELSITHPW